MKKLCEEIHEIAKLKGWWEGGTRSALEIHMLIVSEIAEATEEARKGTKPIYCLDEYKPEGEAIELADAVIRIMDYFAHKGWDLQECIEEKIRYNKGRPYRHGGKKY